MLPMLYSFEAWKKTFNKSKSLKKLVQSDFWVLGSFWDWIKSNVYFESDKVLIINSIALYCFISLVFSLIIYFKGVWALFKFYLIPLIVYHLFMSSFLKLNSEATKKNDYGFVDLPKIIDFLTNNANHAYSIKLKWEDDSNGPNSFSETISSIVPTYNFTNAKEELQKKYREKIETISLNFETLRKIIFENDIKIDWVVTSFLIITPILGLYGVFTCDFNWKTYLVAFIFYYFGGIGITAGYHRLWSHRSYDAHWTVQLALLFLGSSTFEGSVLSWCNDHRKHHRYTDTDKDPYNIKVSFFYAHIGWLFLWREHDESFIQSDLVKDPILRNQHTYYGIWALLSGIITPMAICGLFWNDWKGGLLIAGFMKTVVIMQCTFCINSVAHYIGEATFADERTPRDSYLVSLITFGEGYHNFHHEFPYDYRNGLHFYDYDPGKWLVAFLNIFGLTYNLKRFHQDLFEKGKLQMQEKKILEMKKKYNWGPCKDNLPVINMNEFYKLCENQDVIIIDDFVYTLIDFSHPGGQKWIETFKGKDATKEFNGGVYNHSTAARNLLDTRAIFKIK